MAYVPRRGEVVLVGFPFTGLAAVKVRPAVVVSPAPYHSATADALLAAVSSVVPARRLLPTEVLLRDDRPGFAGTGLKRTSLVLCGKLRRGAPAAAAAAGAARRGGPQAPRLRPRRGGRGRPLEIAST